MKSTIPGLAVASLVAIVAAADNTKFVTDGHVFTHTWATKQALPKKRSDMTATTVGDDIFIIGGCVSDQVWVASMKMYQCGGAQGGASNYVEKYTPTTDTYRTLASAPLNRYRHAAAHVNGKIYLFGGRDSKDNVIAKVDVYDISTDKWAQTGARPDDMPDATSDLSAFVVGGIVYVNGGYNQAYDAQKQMKKFDPSAKTGSQWSSGTAMNQGRGDHYTVLARGKAYAIGGFHHNDWKAPLKDIEEYDPVKATWTDKPDMGHARGDKAVATLNGIVHVIGGEAKDATGGSVALETVEAYNPAGETWHAGGSIPSKRFRFVAATHGNSIYIFGGQGFLEGGALEAVGSKYPVVNNVEAYTETKTLASVSGAADFGRVGFFSAALAFGAAVLSFAH